MSEELEVLKAVTDRLEKAELKYMLSGSMAANYYTVPRMTRDIDIVIEWKTADTKRFVQVFQEGFFIDEDSISSEVQRKGMFNLIHKEYIVKIDFILNKHSDFQETAFLRRKKVVIDNASICLISLEDLILSKLLWAKDSFSEMQIRDVQNLVQTNSGLDEQYLNKWIDRLRLGKIYKRVMDE